MAAHASVRKSCKYKISAQTSYFGACGAVQVRSGSKYLSEQRRKRTRYIYKNQIEVKSNVRTIGVSEPEREVV